MNWEKSKALTPLKRDFLTRFFDRNQSFFLTGGSALGIFYLDHRLSYDLDLFSTESAPMDWHRLGNQVLGVAQEIGATCQSLIAAPDFHRFELRRDAEREILDFVIERVPQVDPVKQQVDKIRVDSVREIIANKLCTLIGRTEIKDLIDLYFLQQAGYDLLSYLPDAQKKEGGLDPAMISYLLADLQVDEVPVYVLQPIDLDALRQFIQKLRDQFAEMAFPTTN
jgi:hypothetical protein